MTGKDEIGKALGEDYLEKYKKLSMANKEPLKEDQRKEALKQIIEKLVDGKTKAHFLEKNGKSHAIILGMAWKDLRIKEFDNGTSVQFVDNGDWFSAVVPKDEVIKVLAEEYYVLTGYMKDSVVKNKDTGETRTYHNMNANAVFTMQEITDFKKEMSEQSEETKEAVQEHQS